MQDCSMQEIFMAFISIAKVEELPPGERIIVEIGEQWIAVFNVGGKFYAIEDICTHDGGPLAEGEIIQGSVECPRHGAMFDLETGRPTFPAVKPVARFAVQVENSEIQIDAENVINNV
jgi:3-phenylpropionate/trans-cinnamate dioxygenase ferredoxin component